MIAPAGLALHPEHLADLRRSGLTDTTIAAAGVRSLAPPAPAEIRRAVAGLRLLLSPLHEGALAPEHRADLAKSGLTEETIQRHRFMSVPPAMIDRLLGFPTPNVVSAYLLPFPDPRGGWFDHVRLKVFPSYTARQGRTVKYLGPKSAAPRLFFCLQTLPTVLAGGDRVWLCEGAKKSLAVAQLGLPAVGFEGIEGWHARGALDLLPDFDAIPLRGRRVELLPDGDVQTNPDVRRGAERFAEALLTRGARPRLVLLPRELVA